MRINIVLLCYYIAKLLIMDDNITAQTVAGYPLSSDLLPIKGCRVFVATKGEVAIVEDF